jgi:Reverse transcriptase (RNA-dependent DNA polymerase)
MFFVSRVCCQRRTASLGLRSPTRPWVPHSVLGPPLFLLFINDIESVYDGKSTLQLFADDVKLYSSVDLHDFLNSLPRSLDRLSAWADQWKLTINISKCSVLRLTSTTHRTSRIYFINGIPIPTNSSCIDLRLTVSDDLSFHTHISCIISKARQRSSTLFRGFLSRRLDIMRTAFITYIRP